MVQKIKRLLIGRPLKNEAIHGEKYKVLWGLPILASDPISSVGYAGEEILLVLVPAIGALSFLYMTYISLAIIGLLLILTFSYNQTIAAYPSGGGAYIVAGDNLGHAAGVTAGTSLIIDYILTVSVSIASGVAQLTSAFHKLLPFQVPLCILVLAILMIGNLRGLKDSSRIFSIPTYAFIVGSLIMILVGFINYKTGKVVPFVSTDTLKQNTAVTIFIILKAFSSGCTALTGVEAVSNAIPNFQQPASKNARKTLSLLSLFVLLIFGGISFLGYIYKVTPDLSGNSTVLNNIALMVFGKGFMYYFYTAASILILVLAANTAFSDFPLLMSIMGKDGYVPRQFSMRGDRLSFSNGIIILSLIAGLLIVAFKGQVTLLIPLYAIGAFTSFTLSQFGMFIRWRKIKGKHWKLKAFINGLGALTTALVVIIFGYEKFTGGAWIVIVITPILVMMFMRVKKHYIAVAKQLSIKPEEVANFDKDYYRNRVIVPLQSINKSSVRALRFAKTISDNIIAFNVSINEEDAAKVEEKYSMLDTKIPLVVKYSPFRKVLTPLLKFIESTEYDYKKGDMITVILPQFEVKSWWQNLLHNNTSYFIRKQLLKHKHIVVATMPLQLKDDNYVLKNPKFK